MRSGELARLARVTVRALRHYHQVGVLDEPSRGSNGYRSYEVHDLVRVLRIKRLASLGIPLEKMPDLLDDVNPDAGSLLDELDTELASQIQQINKQRKIIARLRDHDVSPDLPPELAPYFATFVAAFAGADLPPEMVKMDRDHSVLVAHLAGDEGLPDIARFYERLSDPDLLPSLIAFAEGLGRLDADSTEQDIAALVESSARTFDLIADESVPPVDLGRSADMISEYTAGLLNPQQRRVIEQLESRSVMGD